MRRLRARGVLAGAVLIPLLPALVRPARAAAQDRYEIQQTLQRWHRNAERLAPGRWGIAVTDQRGELIWGIREHELFTPASAVKLLTTGFARSVLGGGARNPTRVYGAGELDRATGAWLGTWALELNGDPSFERQDGSSPTLLDLAQQLRERGIRRLTGPLQVRSADGPAQVEYPAVWSPRHWGRRFAPLVGNLILRENLVTLAVGPGPRVGRPAAIVGEEPLGLGALVANRTRTVEGRGARLALSRRDGGGFVLTGTIGRQSPPRRLTAVSTDPRAVLQAAWAASLKRAGIEWVPGDALLGPGTGQRVEVLAEVASPPLDSLAYEVNRRSLNIGAEALLRWAGGHERAAELLTEHVRFVSGDDNVSLVDGSGLSDDDRVSPHAFTQYLARFPLTPAGRNFAQLLPANGEGTLARLRRGLPAPGVVRAKTGTLGTVSSLVGYLGREDGVLIVSLLYNGPSVAVAKQQQWRIFQLLGARGAPIEAVEPVVPDSLELELDPDLTLLKIGG